MNSHPLHGWSMKRIYSHILESHCSSHACTNAHACVVDTCDDVLRSTRPSNKRLIRALVLSIDPARSPMLRCCEPFGGLCAAHRLKKTHKSLTFDATHCGWSSGYAAAADAVHFAARPRCASRIAHVRPHESHQHFPLAAVCLLCAHMRFVARALNQSDFICEHIVCAQCEVHLDNALDVWTVFLRYFHSSPRFVCHLCDLRVGSQSWWDSISERQHEHTRGFSDGWSFFLLVIGKCWKCILRDT